MHKKPILVISATLAFVLLNQTSTLADVFRNVDKRGRVTYSDQPTGVKSTNLSQHRRKKPPTPTPAGGPKLTGVTSGTTSVSARVGQTVIRTVTLTNAGSSALNVTAAGGDAATGISARAISIAPAKSANLRFALACDKVEQRALSFTLQSNDAANANLALNYNLQCTQAPVAYSGPILITKGGTYSGNWESTDPNIAAVSIKTKEPVIIENCHVRGPGNLIASRFSLADGFTDVDVTVRNCVGVGTNQTKGAIDPTSVGSHFFIGVYPRRAIIENNYYSNTTGVWVIGNLQAGATSELRVVGNRVRNVIGRRNAIAVTEVNATPKLEVAWNEIINDPFASFQEDVILTYKVLGSAADPARLHHNFIDGAYPANPRVDSSTGSGINAGDSGDSTSGNQFVYAQNNHVVRAVNVGMFIAAGTDNLLSNNRIFRSGFLPDGSRINHRFTGIYVWDCCYGQVASGFFKNNIARDNLVGFESVEPDGKVIRHDNKLDDCAKDAAGNSLCTGNTTPSGRVTIAMEDAERSVWLDKVAENGKPIGPN